MSTYVDSSALLKRYVDEADSAAADALLRADDALLTARHTIVEVRRNLARLLSGRDLVAARAAFADDLRSFSIIELDEATCESAAVDRGDDRRANARRPPPGGRAAGLRARGGLPDVRPAPGAGGSRPRPRGRDRLSDTRHGQAGTATRGPLPHRQLPSVRLRSLSAGRCWAGLALRARLAIRTPAHPRPCFVTGGRTSRVASPG